jgi:ATP-dependent helicase YprA (DUF1998 family)
MSSYTASGVHAELSVSLHQYLRAQYHIWDEGLIAERDRILSTPGISFQPPFVEATATYAAGRDYADLPIPEAARRVLIAAAAAVPSTGIPKTPYFHQSKAIEVFSKGDAELVVATGTGSGKTESFLMPILGSLAIESAARASSWSTAGVRCLLLYPMNALVNDQVSRLRKVFGNSQVAQILKGGRAGRATFGMYTSRTPYPGLATKKKDKERLGSLLRSLYIDGVTPQIREMLLREGKWPAKDVLAFLETGYETGADDAELITRHEMQRRAPDLLVTNYSMLEYMMLRPIEASIFEQTRRWLEISAENKFTVVLDEAHMYRGAAGAEVAYLLRRVRSRLGIPRDRIKFILTSASLGSGQEAEKQILEFASKLTGEETGTRFHLITGALQPRERGSVATGTQASLLSELRVETLQHGDASEIRNAISPVLHNLQIAVPADAAYKDLQDIAYEGLARLPVANLVANAITSRPLAVEEISAMAFPNETQSKAMDALEGLFSLMAFAREKTTEKPFASIRAHLFFRGLSGLYACTNSACHLRVEAQRMSPLGRLYAAPKFKCDCGGRVFELLTHRDCGTAYLKGYLSSIDDSFLLSEPTVSSWGDRELTEAHFHVVETGPESKANGPVKWLHVQTGKLYAEKPAKGHEESFLAVQVPTVELRVRGKMQFTIETECPACRKDVGNDPKIMDLATKGEAPFAYLIHTQVGMQAPTASATARAPNAGRKSLLFSDGRQKAARLARDIPRAIESDVFRQLLMLAVEQLNQISVEPQVTRRLYASVLVAASKSGVRLFDGRDREVFIAHVAELEELYDLQLSEALDAFDPPPTYNAHLLSQLCSSFYSLSALGIGYVGASRLASRAQALALSSIDPADLAALGVQWIQRLLGRYAFDRNIAQGVRRTVWPYPVVGVTAANGFSARQREFLLARKLDVVAIENAFARTLCDPIQDAGLFVDPHKTCVVSAVEATWNQCTSCRSTSSVAWWGHCPNCLSRSIVAADQASSSYLRARKGFWRDPVVEVLRGSATPVNLTVEEHTAQLSHKDHGDASTTTEEFERRFRDIFTRPNDNAIDVLSSTTTMEVGIDIGSLVAVGMRNVPPMRQNYQQRAGRAGRRGASISTVITFAQNGAHDASYFLDPTAIVSGDPPRPILDTNNKYIAERHVHAQLVQDFFGPRATLASGGDIFSVLGSTTSFYEQTSGVALAAFGEWLNSTAEGASSLARAQEWLPASLGIETRVVANVFLEALKAARPSESASAEVSLIDHLFSAGLLPSYAFPRDLCSLQIERAESLPRPRVAIKEKPQQGLNVALSEYAPGKLVVVNKKTYRIGSVAADQPSAIQDRAAALFERERYYRYCSTCGFTAGFFPAKDEGGSPCPYCASPLDERRVITPEVVFPEGATEIDEFDDEQIYTRSTAAQFPIPHGAEQPPFEGFGLRGQVAFQRNQRLVVLNEGPELDGGHPGFAVCGKCGKVLNDGEAPGPHERDYHVQAHPGRGAMRGRCNGDFQRAFLGFDFLSDVFLLRIELEHPLGFDFVDRRLRQPMEEALTTLSEALLLGTARVLDIDTREISAGYRFGRIGEKTFADVFVHDTLSGGAGYAYQAGLLAQKVFAASLAILEGCSCDSSCQNCLRHYGNRFYHSSLDRFLGISIAKYIQDGVLETSLDSEAEITALRPLGSLLTLAGWTVSEPQGGGLAVSGGRRSALVRAVPSLVRTRNTPRSTFTPFELQRDLSSAFLEVTE